MLIPAATSTATTTRPASAVRSAFDLKGVMSSLTVLRLRTTDLGVIEQQLRAKVTPLPQFFLDAPVVIDPSALKGGGEGLAWAGLSTVLRMLHLVPVGVTNVSEEHRAAISVARLPIMRLGAGRTRDLEVRAETDAQTQDQTQDQQSQDRQLQEQQSQDRVPDLFGPGGAMGSGSGPSGGASTSRLAAPTLPSTISRAAPPPVSQSAHRPPLVVRQPVRSGQVVYARRGDLVVLAPVNPGAEVIADGHVHIYAALRGRAIAGAQGQVQARIFCQRMEAEILSIAGAYLLSEDIPDERRGRAVQVYLDEAGECRMEPL